MTIKFFCPTLHAPFLILLFRSGFWQAKKLEKVHREKLQKRREAEDQKFKTQKANTVAFAAVGLSQKSWMNPNPDTGGPESQAGDQVLFSVLFESSQVPCLTNNFCALLLILVQGTKEGPVN